MFASEYLASLDFVAISGTGNPLSYILFAVSF